MRRKKLMLPRLKEARKARNLTQLQVAKILGIGAHAYAKIERGEMPIPIRHIAPLAKLLYFTPKDLFKMVYEYKGLL